MTTELANTGAGELSLLDNLAVQARTCVLSARMNLLQLGRVLTEAKPLVPHGEWEAWVKTNAEMSVRAAQGYMQAYATFGLNPDIARLGTTKTMKLLPLSEEERDAYGYYDFLEWTLSDEAINFDLPIFVDAVGNLCVMGRIGSMAGASEFWAPLYPFDDFSGFEGAVG